MKKDIKAPQHPMKDAMDSLEAAISSLDEIIETMSSSAEILRSWLKPDIEPDTKIGWVEDGK
jgi:hypothetical protein